MGNQFRSRSKAEEKEDLRLYRSIEDDISKIRKDLKVMYLSEKERSENFIHGMVMRLDRIESFLSDYLFDGNSVRVIMEGRDGHENSKI